MGTPYWYDTFLQFQYQLESYCSSLPDGFLGLFESLIWESDLQNQFSKPMVWIGIYIALASLFCILPMVADLLHGFKNKKLWFPCKYFTLNAASLTVIAVAMKLPMDLNNSMPKSVDQAAKLGSMAFMCTMMANLLPSLATMDSKELLTNIIALGVLVITLVVNICIQVETGVVANDHLPNNYYYYYFNSYDSYSKFSSILESFSWIIAIFYVAMLLMLLMIHACSALMILKSKQILDSRYKAGHETTLKDVDLQQPTVEKLKQHVSNHWIMAETGSPQFMTVCSAVSSASGWLKVMFGASNSVLVERPVQIKHNRDLSQYVLQLQDDMEIAERTLKSIAKSVTRLIQKAEKHQPNYLMNLLEECSGFEGVGQYDMRHVPSLTGKKFVDCWSLPVVTLTTMAISLPNIQKNKVDRLLRSVSEGLTYVKHVEETLNCTDEYAIIQKAARLLWLEVEVYHKWLGNKLSNPSLQVNATKEIVQWFNETAKNMVNEAEVKNKKGSDDSSLYTSVSANSMYRITQTILVSHQSSIDQVSQMDLFVQLSSMISHILAACLTNLPRVIAMKCHTSVIEKREESVQTAAQLLGETMQIINSLQDRELPSLNPDELPFIDKWRDCFLHSSP
ncbi:uncharacterized protein LOC143628034 [Bidens hawaiensis]|uniref:uncharacterized protein LOC143628034 n=1 Tax=Bidens hawaiensis TaxID=980011 RepID=UPI0040493661